MLRFSGKNCEGNMIVVYEYDKSTKQFDLQQSIDKNINNLKWIIWKTNKKIWIKIFLRFSGKNCEGNMIVVYEYDKSTKQIYVITFWITFDDCNPEVIIA